MNASVGGNEEYKFEKRGWLGRPYYGFGLGGLGSRDRTHKKNPLGRDRKDETLAKARS